MVGKSLVTLNQFNSLHHFKAIFKDKHFIPFNLTLNYARSFKKKNKKNLHC